MTVFNGTAVLAGEGNLPANCEHYPNKRIEESFNSSVIASNASQSLISGNLNRPAFDKLHFYVSSGPSNLTIKTLDGNTVTIQALATDTQINIDLQFSTATWTGTATAVGYYAE